MWAAKDICELLVIGTPPASIPSIISSSYQTYYGRQPNEVPQIRFVCQCRVIGQVIGETIAASNWHQQKSGINCGPMQLFDINVHFRH
jgi:hypothetical protein